MCRIGENPKRSCFLNWSGRNGTGRGSANQTRVVRVGAALQAEPHTFVGRHRDQNSDPRITPIFRHQSNWPTQKRTATSVFRVRRAKAFTMLRTDAMVEMKARSASPRLVCHGWTSSETPLPFPQPARVLPCERGRPAGEPGSSHAVVLNGQIHADISGQSARLARVWPRSTKAPFLAKHIARQTIIRSPAR